MNRAERVASISAKLKELQTMSDAMHADFGARDYALLLAKDDGTLYKNAMKSLREMGEAYIAVGSKTIRTANFVEPILDEMIALGEI